MTDHLKPIEHVLHRADLAIFEKVKLLERAYPQLNGRALRGGILAAGNAVKPAPEDDQTFHVISSQGVKGNEGLGYYIVQLDTNGALRLATCTCPDYFNGIKGRRHGAPRVNGNPKCKHVIAVSILRAIEKDKEKASTEEGTTAEAAPSVIGGPQGPSNGSTRRPTAQPEQYESASVPTMSSMYTGALRSIQGR